MIDLLDSPLGAAILLAFALILFRAVWRQCQKWEEERQAAEAEREYQAWMAERYRDVEVPAFLRQPHPRHRVDEWV
jgi:hypothetical protein